MRFASESDASRQAPNRVACLRAHDSGWSLVVVSSDGGTPKVLAAEFLSAGDAEGVRRVMSKNGASRLVRIIPTGEAVVRCVTLPSGDDAGSRAAVGLMAEAQLPAHIDPHRRRGGLLPTRTGVETRDGMLAGWVCDEAPARILPDDDDETWIPAGGALAWLLSLDPSDESWGAINESIASGCVAAMTDDGLRVRSGRLGDVSGAIAELRHGASIERGRASAFDGRTVEALRAMAPTSGVGPEWLDRHALAIGGALCALAGDALAGLLAEPPRYHYTPGQRAALTLADKGRTRSLILLGLLLLFIAPLALIYARNETLKVKLERAREAVGTEAQEEVDVLVRNASFVRELKNRSVPITKVLGAVADAMPVGEDLENPLGVQIETIDIRPGSSSTPASVTIKGEASSREVAQRFANALSSKKIFRTVPPADVKDNDRGGSTFTLSADLGSVELPFDLAGNFVDEPFAVRLHGDDARGYDYASVTNMGQQPTGSSGSRVTSASSGRDRTARFDDNSAQAQGADPVPEVLGADKISAMGQAEARAAFIERRTASRRSDIDEETKRLLAEDAELLRQRLQALRGGS